MKINRQRVESNSITVWRPFARGIILGVAPHSLVNKSEIQESGVSVGSSRPSSIHSQNHPENRQSIVRWPNDLVNDRQITTLNPNVVFGLFAASNQVKLTFEKLSHQLLNITWQIPNPSYDMSHPHTEQHPTPSDHSGKKVSRTFKSAFL